MDSVPGSESKSNTNSDDVIATKSTKAAKSLTYYVGEGNGWRFIKAALDKRGWQQIPFEYKFSTRFAMKWVERRSQIDYSSHHEGQVTFFFFFFSLLIQSNLYFFDAIVGQSYSK